MTKRIIVMAVLVYCLTSCIFHNNIYAQNGQPFELTGEADTQEQIITVCITVPDNITLEAFTLHLLYNEDECKLYTGNDELPGGYCYNKEFQSQYEAQGMLLANDLPGRVIFTGVCSETEENTRGVLAYISFLYNGKIADTDIHLAVTALRANGSTVDVQDESYKNISCNIITKETVDDSTFLPGTDMPEAGMQSQTDGNISDIVSGSEQEKRSIVPFDTDSYETQSGAEAEVQEVTGNFSEEKESDAVPEREIIISPEAVTPDAYKVQAQKEKENAKEEHSATGIRIYSLVCIPMAVVMFIVFIYKKVLPEYSKCNNQKECK